MAGADEPRGSLAEVYLPQSALGARRSALGRNLGGKPEAEAGSGEAESRKLEACRKECYYPAARLSIIEFPGESLWLPDCVRFRC